MQKFPFHLPILYVRTSRDPNMIRLLFVLLLADFVRCGLSISIMEYGLTQTEKVLEGICWLEDFIRSSKSNNATVSNSNCSDVVDYIETFKSISNQIGRKGALTAEHEEKFIFSEINPIIDRILGESLANYRSCQTFLKVNQDVPKQGPRIWRDRLKQKPSYDYEWLLRDEDKAEYPYKGLAHCLLGIAERQHGEEALIQLKVHWASLRPSNASTKPNTGPSISNFSIRDVQYGLAQAQKVAAVVCWIEYLNQSLPTNDEQVANQNCKICGNDSDSLGDSQERDVQNWEEEINKNSFIKPTGDAFIQLLPGYNSCVPFLQDVIKVPNKDYGELLGDSKRGNYPYKGYTHCLLQVMEDRYGKPGLENFTSKWTGLQQGMTRMLRPVLKLQNAENNSLNLVSTPSSHPAVETEQNSTSTPSNYSAEPNQKLFPVLPNIFSEIQPISLFNISNRPSKNILESLFVPSKHNTKKSKKPNFFRTTLEQLKHICPFPAGFFGQIGLKQN